MSPLGRATGALLLLAGLLTGLISPAGPSAVADELPVHHPDRLAGLAESSQVLVATAPGWTSSRARLRAYERGMDGEWRLAYGPVDARVGRSGWAPAATRRQGSRTTPAGTFRLPRAFGTEPDPGSALPYRLVDDSDWWPYDPQDPATYNVLQTRRSAASDWRAGWAEDLSEFGRQYRHAVVIGFNLPSRVRWDEGEWVATRRADIRRGGGIFLHVLKAPRFDRATTGCVAVEQRDLLSLLQWLDPAANPRIVMGPRSALGRA